MTDVTEPATDEERLAVKLARVTDEAREQGDAQTVADLERLPTLADEIAVAEGLYSEREAIFVRLADKGVSRSVIGHAAKGSKSLVGYVLGKARKG